AHRGRRSPGPGPRGGGGDRPRGRHPAGRAGPHLRAVRARHARAPPRRAGAGPLDRAPDRGRARRPHHGAEPGGPGLEVGGGAAVPDGWRLNRRASDAPTPTQTSASGTTLRASAGTPAPTPAMAVNSQLAAKSPPRKIAVSTSALGLYFSSRDTRVYRTS